MYMIKIGQYSWLITIKNGASHPMVHRDYNNHCVWILIMDGMTINDQIGLAGEEYGSSLLYIAFRCRKCEDETYEIPDVLLSQSHIR